MKLAGKKQNQKVFWGSGGFDDGFMECKKQIDSWLAKKPNIKAKVWKVGVKLIWSKVNKATIKVERHRVIPGDPVRHIKIEKKSDAKAG